MKRIRIGNDINIAWTLLDSNGDPYDLTGKSYKIFLSVGFKNIEFLQTSVSGEHNNTVGFEFLGMDQMFTGKYSIKYVENEGQQNMVTMDVKNIFALVPHSWQVIGTEETLDTVSVETIELTTNLDCTAGPPGASAYEIAVQHGYVGTEEEWLESLHAQVTRINVLDALRTEPSNIDEYFVIDCGTSVINVDPVDNDENEEG